MLFNSLHYLFFLPMVFFIYWYLNNKSLKLQNFMLLAVSYFFYACWDWRFLFLLMFSTGLDYFTGLKMYDSTNEKNRKIWFWLSIVVNVGFLGIFKYYNFFAESLANTLTVIGFNVHFKTLEVILPVGISFYTFHGLSYVIDIYKKRIVPERNLVDYSLFVSYFPLLVAGPIERATHLLPQIKKTRVFNYNNAVDGLRQILWGLFKKVVIADNCAQFVNVIFDKPEAHTGSTLLVVIVLFAFQIYGDFSGYSDIALGSSRLFGIELLRNFNYPYFSRDIAEFWRRWHISLSTWFRDYLYIPLGGSKGGVLKKIRNTFIIFLVSGFWHGANWTFIVWGLLNALYIMPSIIKNTNRINLDSIAKDSLFPSFKELAQVVLTFFLTCIAWIFFRAKSLEAAFNYLETLFSKSLFTLPQLQSNQISFKILVLLLIFFLVIEWINRKENHGLYMRESDSKIYKWVLYFIVFAAIVGWGVATKSEFIYFAF